MRIYNIILISILNILFCSTAIFAKTTAEINNYDSNELTTDSIIELTITTDQTNSTEIDSSPITYDFTLINQSKQVYHSIINGQSSSKIQWVLSLTPKKFGKLVIPALTVGKDTTKPISINVKQPVVDLSKPEEIFITVETDKQSTYEYSPVEIKVSIFIDNNITPRNLALDASESKDYDLYKVDESNKSVFYKNKRYTQYNITYLGFFKSTGDIQLPQFNLSGLRLKNQKKSNDLFSLYNQQWLPFYKKSVDSTIKVTGNPIEAANTKTIAADNIIIQQSWSVKDNDLKLGDAVQRNITITGINIPSDRLPALYQDNETINASNYKAYIDKPEQSYKIENGKLISVLKQTVTYITTNPGDIVLPNKKLTWWNNKINNKVESTIEGKAFKVIAGAKNSVNSKSDNSSANKSIVTNQKSLDQQPSPTNQLDYNKSNNQNNHKIIDKNNSESNTPLDNNALNNRWLVYILSFIILSLLILVIFLLYTIDKIKKSVDNKSNSNSYNHSTSLYNNHADIKAVNTKLKSLKKQLKESFDEKSIYTIISEVSNLLYPNSSNSLNQLKKALSSHGLKCIDKLMNNIYGHNKINIELHEIEILVDELKKIANNTYKKDQTKNNIELPELYPE